MKLRRRELLSGGLAATVAHPAAALAQGARAAEAVPNSLLWYSNPARIWEEALPLGNGRLGAMVFGGIKRERIQLNEETLWSGGPYRAVNPRALAALPRVRQLIFEGKYREAEALAAKDLQSEPMRQMSYQALGDLLIDLPGINETSATDYRRSLDLDAAVATTRFTSEGKTVTREAFASLTDGVLVIHLSAGGAPFDVAVTLTSGQRVSLAADSGALVMAGWNNEDRGIAGQLRFEARLAARADGGEIAVDNGGVTALGARSLTLLLAAATSHRGPNDVTADPAERTRTVLSAALARSDSDLLARHQAAHRKLFRRVSIDLGSSGRGDRPTDQRVRRNPGNPDPALAALYFQYGRYLLIASSPPGAQPANLQGKWNDSNQPPWGSKYTININAEMNYWPADSANLPECFEPFVRMVEELAASGAETARKMYGARGWVAHHNTDLWRNSGPADHARTGIWPCGGAWLACQLWDHWDYHRDDAYLRRIYPVLRDAALFFVDTLQSEPGTGLLVTNPSNSPENEHPHGSTLCAGPAMDSQILRDLFDRICDAARRLGRDSQLAAQFAATRRRLAPDQIGAAGQLQEWRADWDGAAPDPHHRHVSHLYALYPGQQIDIDATPALAAAAKRSLDTRGDDATGWGLGWRLNLWARLRDGERANAILTRLLSPERTYPNLFDAHPPFQIDGNFGGAAGIIEMLAQSREERILLLPALPRAWPTGAIRGIRLRGGIGLDLSWREGVVETATLTAATATRRTVAVGSVTREVRLRGGRPLKLAGAALTSA
ncbi:glycoside hydrolase family 95 protein [Sphingomonas sp.]|uniref:glycoside hydrolase family 95 protein n=1 Tax=Sphingomonas sp. TaxID=28214 RepID=UPI0031D51B6D